MANARTELLMKATHQLDNAGQVIFGVFTLPLRRGHDLKYRYQLLNATKDRFRRYLKPLERHLGIIYSSRYLDEAWGEEFGWNPHFNWVFFVPEGVSAQDVSNFMSEVPKLWIKAASLGGTRGVSPLSQSMELISNQHRVTQVSKYITHHSYYPMNFSVQSKRAGGKWKGLLPFEVLEAAIKFDRRLEAAWKEFEVASKGRHRVCHYSNLITESRSSAKRPSISLSESTDPDFS